ncbi:cytochrome P450 [Roseicitreum antarcticum]|uniref:Cytochrome P450 n=1 Tax=Roseicitreum antarcticum TaxID=564137 RepID=A0A1H3A5D7_9RHOB|nr:cytochrome P450 [Roseicitreum antarcticum]SDX24815.1 Cytochrome P450 [Roseicitreum antarcticum]
MQRIAQSPLEPGFVQNPYPFYDRMRALGPVVWWEDYGMPCAVSYAAVNAIMRDRRFGREPIAPLEVADHMQPFYAVEAHSMLELEPPRHTRLRGLVVRAFTSRRIAALEPEITALAHQLVDALPEGEFDLLTHIAQPLPVIVIARLLGVPDHMADDLLRWSNAMVAMYQAGRTRAVEDAASAAARDFSAYLRDHIAARRHQPADDLITHLIAAEGDDDRLSTEELITTCILLLNAGHEATVHTIGNGVKALLQSGQYTADAPVEPLVEEVLRFDPPLHMFTRIAYSDIDVMGHTLRRGDQVACLLAAANRDPGHWDRPNDFDPRRVAKPNAAFGAGLHFCVGAPLARLELAVMLPILMQRLPGLRLARPPKFAPTYHFHGLSRLDVLA